MAPRITAKRSAKKIKAHALAQRAHSLRRRYNVTIAEYEAMFIAQNGLCAGCKKPPKRGSVLGVDHAHRTPEEAHAGALRGDDPHQVRGLLCTRCNTQLSGFESKEIAAWAVPYLAVPPAHAVLRAMREGSISNMT